MAIQFTLAAEVAKGEALTSRKMNQFFQAINDRVGGQFGGCAWRIWFAVFSMWREGVLDMVGGQGSPMEDFLPADPARSPGIRWPVGGLDESFGATTFSQMAGNIFGVGTAVGDTERVNFVPLRTSSGPPIGSLLWKWMLGIDQRGGFCPETGERNAPAFDAAESTWQVDVQLALPHARSWGGYQPARDLVPGATCEPLSDGTIPENQIVRFTRIQPEAAKGQVVQYDGTCPENPDGVAAVYELGRVYIVSFNNRSRPPEIFLRSQWIEGPYHTGGRLQKRMGGQMGRVEHWYLKDFSGSESQREEAGPSPKLDFPGGGWDPKKVGFDTENFLKGQYGLAPNIATSNGDGNVTIQLPLFALTHDADGDNLSAGSYLREATGGVSGHTYRDGFVLGGWYAQGAGLEPNAAVRVEVVSGMGDKGEQVIDEIVLQANAKGEAEVLRNYTKYPGYCPKPLRFRLQTALKFAPTTDEPHPQLLIGCNEILSYQPDRWDQYVVMRLMTADASPRGGKEFEGSRAQWDAYAADGMISSGAPFVPEEIGEEGDGTAYMNLSPKVEAGRDLSQNIAKLFAPDRLKGYAVENGTTVLYFQRFGASMGEGILVDLWNGIAPEVTDLTGTEIAAGTEYVVRTPHGEAGTGAITYHGNDYTSGQRFIGVAGALEATKAPGSNLILLEWEGIKKPFTREHKARGESNEWVLWPELKMYSVPGGSFDEDQYGRMTPLNNRCLFGSNEIGHQLSPLNFQEVFGNTEAWTGPAGWEAPSDYIYAEGTNHGDGATVRPNSTQRLAFYNSCPVFRAPYKMTSVTSQWNADGYEEVRVEFERRWQAFNTAPASINRNVATWDLESLAAEGQSIYGELVRSDENGVREYLARTLGDPAGYGQCRRRIGDTANGSDIVRNFDNLHGACVGHFLAVKLMPMFYEDGNDEQNPKVDTRVVTERFIQAEWYIRYMCEGFVDEVTTTAAGCDAPAGRSGLVDYTFPNLLFNTSDGERRWVSPMGQEDRADLPEGFGPGEVTPMRADQFNVLVRAVNALNKVRLMMPSTIEVKTHRKGETTETNVTFPAGSNCTGLSHDFGIILGAGEGSGPETDVDEDWGPPVAGIFAECAQALIGCFDPTMGTWAVNKSGSWTEFRLAPVDDMFWFTMSDEIKQLLQSGAAGFIGHEVETVSTQKAVAVSTQAESDGCEFPDNTPPEGAHGDYWDGTTGYRMEGSGSTTRSGCKLIKSGSFHPEVAAPAGDLDYIRKAHGEVCGAGTERRWSFEVDLTVDPFVEIPVV